MLTCAMAMTQTDSKGRERAQPRKTFGKLKPNLLLLPLMLLVVVVMVVLPRSQILTPGEKRRVHARPPGSG